MPNYIYNSLVINGSQHILKHFYEKNRVTQEDVDILGRHLTELSFENMISRSTCEYIEKKYNLENLHIDYWGTKWDAKDVRYTKRNDEEIIYSFDTAWAPPLQWLSLVSKIYSQLNFKISCVEEGMQGDGVHTWEFKNGEQVSYKLDEITYEYVSGSS